MYSKTNEENNSGVPAITLNFLCQIVVLLRVAFILVIELTRIGRVTLTPIVVIAVHFRSLSHILRQSTVISLVRLILLSQ